MKFERLTQEEIDRVLWHVPGSVQRVLQNNNVVLAGGAIRDTLAGLTPKDIDIFCHSEEQASRLALEVSPLVRHTTFAYTAEVGAAAVPVQFVYYKDFSSIYDLIGQFDFRACCAGIAWVGTGLLIGEAVEGFHIDCQAKVLRFMSQKKDENKLTALRRALNFAGKGWTISNDEVVSIITHWDTELEPERVRFSFRPAYGRV